MQTSTGARAQTLEAEIAGELLSFRFDMLALSLAEGVYLERYGVNANAGSIIAEMMESKMRAAVALGYGALRSANPKADFLHFTRDIMTHAHFDQITDVLTRGLAYMMGDETDRSTEDEAKN